MTDLEVDFDPGTRNFILRLDAKASFSDERFLKSRWWSGSTTASGSGAIMVPEEKLISESTWFGDSWVSSKRKFHLTDRASNRLSSLRQDRDLLAKLLDEGPDIFEASRVSQPQSRQLTESQLKNVQQLLGMKAGANFSVPGAGKTFMTLAVWMTLTNEGAVNRLLVFCPKSAFESWAAESKLFGLAQDQFEVFHGVSIHPRTRILVCNYEQLQNEGSRNKLEGWVRATQTHLVFDEVHRVKAGANSIRWRECHNLARHATRVDILSGTPMPQGFSDLRNEFRLAWPDLLDSDLPDPRLARMRRGMTFVRTTKAELGLPNIDIRLIEHAMSPLQSEIYSSLVRRYLGTLRLRPQDEFELARRGRAVMNLIAAASNPGLLSSIDRHDSSFLVWPLEGFDAGDDLYAKLETYPGAEIPWKFHWIAAYIGRQSLRERKTIIWTNFIGNIRSLDELLATHSPAVVYGATKHSVRESELSRFRLDPDCHVLITNPQTLGEGISLHDVCHDAVYVDRTFNAGLYLQSQDRIHRLGVAADQKTNVTVLSSLSTVDENIEARLATKIARLGLIMNDTGLVSTAGATPYDPVEDTLGISDLMDLAASDFEELFGHLRIPNLKTQLEGP